MEIDHGSIPLYEVKYREETRLAIRVRLSVMCWIDKYHPRSYGWHKLDTTDETCHIAVNEELLTLLKLYHG